MKTALPPRRSRWFVTALLVVMVGLAVFAATLIVRSWGDEAFQARMRRIEATREAAPR